MPLAQVSTGTLIVGAPQSVQISAESSGSSAPHSGALPTVESVITAS